MALRTLGTTSALVPTLPIANHQHESDIPVHATFANHKVQLKRQTVDTVELGSRDESRPAVHHVEVGDCREHVEVSEIVEHEVGFFAGLTADLQKARLVQIGAAQSLAAARQHVLVDSVA